MFSYTVTSSNWILVKSSGGGFNEHFRIQQLTKKAFRVFLLIFFNHIKQINAVQLCSMTPSKLDFGQFW